jgi:hypothetical protein
MTSKYKRKQITWILGQEGDREGQSGGKIEIRAKK